MRKKFDPSDFWEDEPTNPFARVPRPRVLVAEDDPKMREMVSDRLRRDGCDVVDVATGDEALGLMDMIAARQAPIDDLDLVIMDVRMPGLSGIEVVYLLRAFRWNTPILLMTAYPEPALLDEADRLGVPILAKPFGFSRLTEAAGAAMRERPSFPTVAR
ncbi:MAG: response regulator [Kofleriaceae bacterium]